VIARLDKFVRRNEPNEIIAIIGNLDRTLYKIEFI
jgi:hypothetical protein